MSEETKLVKEKKDGINQKVSVFIAYLIAIISVITMCFIFFNCKKTEYTPKYVNEDGSFVLTKSEKVSKDFVKKNARQYEWYTDVWCPDCIRVHQITHNYVNNAINGGEIEIKYHPINFLSHKSKNYSLIGAAWITGVAEHCNKDIVLKIIDILYTDKSRNDYSKLNDNDFIKILIKLTLENGATKEEVENIKNNLNMYKAMINSGSVNIRRMPEWSEISQKEDNSCFVPFIFNVKERKAYDGENKNVNDEVLAKLKGNLDCDDCSDLTK